MKVHGFWTFALIGAGALLLGAAFVSRSRRELFDLLNDFAADLQISDPFEGLQETRKFSDCFFVFVF
jgi:LPXTG-motif cell wall-anchored protein